MLAVLAAHCTVVVHSALTQHVCFVMCTCSGTRQTWC
jgi:hypothetical protein